MQQVHVKTMLGYEYIKQILLSGEYDYVEEEDFISFSYQGTNYIAFKNDSPYLQISLICSLPEIDRLDLLETCNYMNDKKFSVKFVAHDDMIWCNYELIPTPSFTRVDFELLLTLLDSNLCDFFRYLSERQNTRN